VVPGTCGNPSLAEDSAGPAFTLDLRSTCSTMDPLPRWDVPHRNLNLRAGVSNAARARGRMIVNNIIYIVGLVVIVLAVLAFFGLR
jgi:hypothetical protein